MSSREDKKKFVIDHSPQKNELAYFLLCDKFVERKNEVIKQYGGLQ